MAQYTVEIELSGRKKPIYKVVRDVKNATEARRKARKSLPVGSKVKHMDVFKSGNY